MMCLGGVFENQHAILDLFSKISENTGAGMNILYVQKPQDYKYS